MTKNISQRNEKQSITILIVEDELFNYIYFSEVLKLHDIQSIKAENGEEAVEKARNHPDLDLILMDIKMPFMDGYQAYKEIRKIMPHVPIVAQTAYALSHERQEILDYGFNDYIAKPVEEETLIEVIRKNLKQ